MTLKTECFKFIQHFTVDKMTDDVNLLTSISGGDRTINPVQIKIPIRVYEITQFFHCYIHLMILTADSFYTMDNSTTQAFKI